MARFLQNVTFSLALAVMASLLSLPLTARDASALAFGESCNPTKPPGCDTGFVCAASGGFYSCVVALEAGLPCNPANSQCATGLICKSGTDSSGNFSKCAVPDNNNPYTPLLNCTDALGTVPPFGSCTDGNGVVYGTCDGATGQCFNNGTPEMSDMLAAAFIVVAGGMLYYFRRKKLNA